MQPLFIYTALVYATPPPEPEPKSESETVKATAKEPTFEENAGGLMDIMRQKREKFQSR